MECKSSVMVLKSQWIRSRPHQIPGKLTAWGQGSILGEKTQIFRWNCIFSADPSKSQRVLANLCKSERVRLNPASKSYWIPANASEFSQLEGRPGSSVKKLKSSGGIVFLVRIPGNPSGSPMNPSGSHQMESKTLSCSPGHWRSPKYR